VRGLDVRRLYWRRRRVHGGTHARRRRPGARAGDASELTLQQNYPNPFNPTTTIAFSLPEKTRVALAIYDVNGRLVTTLVDAELGAGFKEYRWDGTDSHRRPVGSGVYFCRLDTGTRTLSRRWFS